MTNLTRKNQKIFAANALNNGQFGSLQTGAKVLSNDLDVLQNLPAYQNGWNDAVISGEELPSLEEFQALNYINTYQTGYILQKGIPEWNVETDYYIGDITREVGGTKLYKSSIDGNSGLDIAATAYNAGTTYEVDDVAMDTNGDIYRSLTGGNIGNPLTDPVNWELVWIFLLDLETIQVQAASQVEVEAGVISDKYVSPNTLLGLFNSGSQSTNGYVRIPVNIGGSFNEIIIQWGFRPSLGAFSFPLTFPNAALSISVARRSNDGQESLGVSSLSNSGATFASVEGMSGNYIVIGY